VIPRHHHAGDAVNPQHGLFAGRKADIEHLFGLARRGEKLLHLIRQNFQPQRIPIAHVARRIPVRSFRGTRVAQRRFQLNTGCRRGLRFRHSRTPQDHLTQHGTGQRSIHSVCGLGSSFSASSCAGA
jgi:hypothetical protein